MAQSGDGKEKRAYIVLHGGVHNHWQGQTITDDHLEGLDVQRLLDLGAIAPLDSDAAKDAIKAGLPEKTPEGKPVTEVDGPKKGKEG